MDVHASRLQGVCRVGGVRFSRLQQATRYAVSDYASDIQSVFQIDTTRDDPTVHPQFICAVCVKVLKRISEGGKYRGGGCGEKVEWVAHDLVSCNFCLQFGRGGRPCKKKRVAGDFEGQARTTFTGLVCNTTEGTPDTCTQSACSTTLTEKVSEHTHTESGIDLDSPDLLSSVSTPAYRAGTDLDCDRFVSPVSFAACCICRLVLDSAVESSCCSTMFCLQCIWQWLYGHPYCPMCRKPMQTSDLKTPHRFVHGTLSSLELHCDFYESPIAWVP